MAIELHHIPPSHDDELTRLELKKDFCEKLKDIELEIDK